MADNNAKNFMKNLLGYFTVNRKPIVRRQSTAKTVTTKTVTATPLTEVKGIGKATATKLASVGITSVEDATNMSVTDFLETSSESGISPTMLRKYYTLFETHDNEVSR